jgi:hypothetical protein
MNTPAKLGVFTLGLAAVFGAAAGVGAAVGPVGPAAPSPAAAAHDTATHDRSRPAGPTDTTDAPSAAHLPAGLQVSQDGYTFDVARELTPSTPDGPTQVTFRIVGPDGRPVTAYETAHDQDLHLIAVRRDLTGYQHVHPRLADDGTWSVPLDLTAGSWRLFADFDPAGDDDALVLGADVAVAGAFAPEPLPEPSTTAEVDGYTVTLDGRLDPGTSTELTLTVDRDGEPVTDLQPYLAAYGHLVALRDGDLAYLHVHPTGEPGDGTTAAGPGITFHTTAPSAGDYRLFLDFRHGDVVRTAELTVRAGDTAGPTADDAPAPTEGTGDQAPDQQAPDEQAPDERAPDEHGGDGHSHG